MKLTFCSSLLDYRPAADVNDDSKINVTDNIHLVFDGL